MPSASRRERLARWRGLYAIVDPAFCRGRDPLAVTAAILEGGCGVVQLRAKRMEPAEMMRISRDMLKLCRAAQVPFVVNDEPELARIVGADGVHLGQTDMPIEAARAIVGPDLVIGLSTHDLKQALEAEGRGADLIGFGPIFPTRTKDNPAPVVGIAALREICLVVRVPVVAIGGVGPDNIAEVAASGADLAAAVSALCSAGDPSAAGRELDRPWRRVHS